MSSQRRTRRRRRWSLWMWRRRLRTSAARRPTESPPWRANTSGKVSLSRLQRTPQSLPFTTSTILATHRHRIAHALKGGIAATGILDAGDPAGANGVAALTGAEAAEVEAAGTVSGEGAICRLPSTRRRGVRKTCQKKEGRTKDLCPLSWRENRWESIGTSLPDRLIFPRRLRQTSKRHIPRRR